MEDDLNGRQPHWKMTTMKDDHNGRRTQWKKTSMEDDLNGRQSQWKMTSRKPYRKQMTPACLASKSFTELGPAQPQLVFLFNQKSVMTVLYVLCVSFDSNCICIILRLQMFLINRPVMTLLKYRKSLQKIYQNPTAA